MLRIVRGPGRLEVVSRLARPRAVAVLVAGCALAAAALRERPALAGGLGLLALAVLLVAGRGHRALLAGGRVRVIGPLALPPGRADRALGEFSGAAVETVGEARRRRAARHAEQYRARTGGAELPTWLQAPERGTNDHLRRLVLLPRRGEPLALTGWLADDDLGPLREEVEALLGGGAP